MHPCSVWATDMGALTGPVTRILLRYVAGVLVARGFLGDASVISDDPDIYAIAEFALGVAIASATEWWYWLAHRMGWSK